jgi:hypothetical protein
MEIYNYKGQSYAPALRNKRYTLDDLESNDEFQEISERFLTSIGENSNDIFEYLRDSDFNLYTGMQRAMQTGNFTDQQKKDYAFLRSRFDGADMGSLKQYLELIKDSSVDMVTDPTLAAAVLTTPISGGTSFLARAALGKGATEAAKLVSKSQIKNITPQKFNKLLQDRTKLSAGITGAEVGAWTGADNYFRQKTELNTDMRKMFSTPELVGSGLLGAIGGAAFGGLSQVSANFPLKMLKKYSDDNYRLDANSDFMYNARRILDIARSKTIGKSVSFLKQPAKLSNTANKFGQVIDETFQQGITSLSKKRQGYSYIEDLSNRKGNYFLKFDEALAPIRPNGTLSDIDEIAVLKILRGANPNNNNFSDQQRKSASLLRTFFDNIYEDAVEAGIPIEKVENYFPRSWNREAIEKDRPSFEKALVDNDIVEQKDVREVVNGMLNKQNELYASHSNLITQARKFKNLDDNKFDKYLNNNLLEVTVDYYSNAARIIQQEESFLKGAPRLSVTGTTKIGEQDALLAYRNSNLERFKANWTNKINDELEEYGKRLSIRDEQRLNDVYKSVTGQLEYFDGVVQGVYETYKLANAMAYLPLATVSSLTEAMIPFTKAKPSSAVKGTLEGIKNADKIFKEEAAGFIKDKYKLSDEQVRKEMAQVWIGIDEAMGDVTNRLSGEGLQNKFLRKAARGFYRLNLLVPWTKTVQLSSFSTGKDLIRDNLQKLAGLQNQGVKIFDEEQILVDSINKSKNKTGFQAIIENVPLFKEITRNKDLERVQVLKSQLFDLGIDVEDGVRWVKSGASLDSNFYKNQLIRGAGRFANQVILQTSREGGKLPTYFNSPRFDIFTQFLRYPTMFSNTILKNFARDTITNPLSNIPRIAGFAILATSVALATNYWRASEEVRAQMDAEKDIQTNIIRAFQRVGLLGPIEYTLRYNQALEYTPNPLVAGASLLGPVAGDVVNSIAYNRGFLETAARKAPLVGTKGLIDRYAGDYLEDLTGVREPYTPLRKYFREGDKAARRFLMREEGESTRPTFRKFKRRNLFEGGEVEKDVPSVKNEPENRIDPYTGLPYAAQSDIVKSSIERENINEQMDRLGFAEGKEVVGEEVITNAINNIVQDKNVRKFLKEIAYVESKFGTDKNTFREQTKSVFQIDDIAFQELQRRLNPESDVGKSIREYNKYLKLNKNIDLTKVSFNDLNRPDIGAAASRAILLSFPEPIPETRESRAIYWKNNWNKSGEGKPEKYLKDLENVQFFD